MSMQDSDLLQACVDQLLQYFRTVTVCNTRSGWHAEQSPIENSTARLSVTYWAVPNFHNTADLSCIAPYTSY